MSRPARYISHAGHNLTIAEWAKRCDLSASSIARRIKQIGTARALESAVHPKTLQSPKSTPEKPMADPFEPDQAPKQRTVTLPSRASGPPPLKAGARVRVYHKRNTRMFLTDCSLGPHEEREILVSDLAIPAVAAHVVKLAA